MALRLSSNLLVGISRVFHVQYTHYLNDVQQVFVNLKRNMFAMSADALVVMPAPIARMDAITVNERAVAAHHLNMPSGVDNQQLIALGWLPDLSNVSGFQDSSQSVRGNSQAISQLSLMSAQSAAEGPVIERDLLAEFEASGGLTFTSDQFDVNLGRPSNYNSNSNSTGLNSVTEKAASSAFSMMDNDFDNELAHGALGSLMSDIHMESYHDHHQVQEQPMMEDFVGQDEEVVPNLEHSPKSAKKRRNVASKKRTRKVLADPNIELTQTATTMTLQERFGVDFTVKRLTEKHQALELQKEYEELLLKPMVFDDRQWLEVTHEFDPMPKFLNVFAHLDQGTPPPKKKQRRDESMIDQDLNRLQFGVPIHQEQSLDDSSFDTAPQSDQAIEAGRAVLDASKSMQMRNTSIVPWKTGIFSASSTHNRSDLPSSVLGSHKAPSSYTFASMNGNGNQAAAAAGGSRASTSDLLNASELEMFNGIQNSEIDHSFLASNAGFEMLQPATGATLTTQEFAQQDTIDFYGYIQNLVAFHQKQDLMFNEDILQEGPTRYVACEAFYHVLELTSMNKFRVKQDRAYGVIFVTCL